MNKIFKGVVLSLLAMAGLASCGDDYDYTAATAPTGAQVYFPTSNPTTYTLSMSDDIQTINVPIERANTTDAVAVGLQLTVAQHSSAFSIPSQVSFAAGESETTVPLSYDASALGYESTDTLYITIADDFATSYGVSEYKCIVNLPSPLRLLGTGTFVEGYWYEGENPVEVYQNELNPNIYRIMNPFNEMTIYDGKDDSDGSQSEYVDITILQPGETFAGVQITKNDLIYFAPISTGYFYGDYGEYVYLYHPAHFNDYSNEEAWSHNKVVEWQENGLPGRIQLAPFYYMPGVGGWNKTTVDDLVYIDFPGYEPKDLSSELFYSGIFSSADETVYAVGNLKLGADVKTAKAVVVDASADAAAVADAIAAGDLEAINVAAGRIEVPIAEGLTGKLQLVAVVLDGGSAKTVSSAYFEYYGGGKSPWESLGTGFYVDDFVMPMFVTQAGEPLEPYAYEVEIEENTETPGVYRIINAYAPVAEYLDFEGGNENIEINASTPDGVYILEQRIGMDIGKGDVSIVTEGGDYVSYFGDFDFVYQNAPELFGTLKDGVITFPFLYEEDYDINYQGYTVMGGNYYFAGKNNAVEIYLPKAYAADASLRAKALSRAKAASFEKRLNGIKKVSSKQRTFSKKIIKTAKLKKAF